MLSIPEFLDEHRISRSLLYRLIKEGRGPRITKIAGRTLISAEAAADWRAQMERETEQAAVRPKPAENRGRPASGRAGPYLREAA
jgi:hypothetical protein